MVAGMAAAADKNPPTDAKDGFAWKSDIPDDCPFERSKTLTGIFFTGRHSDYHCGELPALNPVHTLQDLALALVPVAGFLVRHREVGD